MKINLNNKTYNFYIGTYLMNTRIQLIKININNRNSQIGTIAKNKKLITKIRKKYIKYCNSPTTPVTIQRYRN